MAHRALAPYHSHTRAIFAPFKRRRVSYNSLSALGKLCGIPEPRRGDTELNIKTPDKND